MPAGEPDPLEILRALERHGVRYVLIGAAAARIAGAPVVIDRLEVTPVPDGANQQRLAAALRELGARLQDAVDLVTQGAGIVHTSEGDLDLCFAPAGTGGYDDLRREASDERLGRGLTVSVASLRDVIRSKEAAGRDKDLAQLPLLRRTLEQIRERDRP
jgi:hypothetical protein